MDTKLFFLKVQPFELDRDGDGRGGSALAREFQDYACRSFDGSAVTGPAWDGVVAELERKIAELSAAHPEDTAPTVSVERKDPPALWVTLVPDKSRPWSFDLVFDIYAKPIRRLIEEHDGHLVYYYPDAEAPSEEGGVS